MHILDISILAYHLLADPELGARLFMTEFHGVRDCTSGKWSRERSKIDHMRREVENQQPSCLHSPLWFCT